MSTEIATEVIDTPVETVTVVTKRKPRVLRYVLILVALLIARTIANPMMFDGVARLVFTGITALILLAIPVFVVVLFIQIIRRSMGAVKIDARKVIKAGGIVNAFRGK